MNLGGADDVIAFSKKELRVFFKKPNWVFLC
jgi:hypothetical protein